MNDYEIAIDSDRHFLRMTMRGYWDTAIFEAFAREFRRALHILNQTGGARRALVDGREFAVQSSEIAEMFGKLIADCYGQMAPRTATLVSATLNKLQSDRAGVQNARYFNDPAEAEAWLFEEDEPPLFTRAAK
ncbi:hypothetical protein [Sphingobium nicotianae]|uniref:STAS/SEC14 domain-containing protein n=1 Tax=Sphingobium nicotianae TaxID=2782607 RepID=A0A9X1IQ32_9SPHN|nr:hypothetical protein [Sphingobium nicotianae]MBT2186255.1 hypothetical protein [Sphingobium nicotianae]